MRSLILLPALFVALFVLACGGDSEPPPEPTATVPAASPTPNTASPEASLGNYIEETLGETFLEDCSRAVVEEVAGKICSIFRGERGDLRAYILGRTFSEPFQWAILEKQGTDWRVIHTPAIRFDTAGVPGIPWPLTSGTDVVVVGADPCVNVREGPGLDQTAVDCLSDGTIVQLSLGPIMADDFEWWQLAGRAGWVVADFLRYPDSLDPAELAPESTATPE